MRTTHRSLLAAAVGIVALVATALPSNAALVAPPTPPNGTVQGTITIADDGASSGGQTSLFATCNGFTTISVRNASNTVVATTTVNGLGGGTSPASLNWVTDSVPNGTYTATAQSRKNAITVVFFCTNPGATTTGTRTYTVANQGNLQYGGDGAKPTGATAVVKATLTDQNGVVPATPQTVTFALSDGSSVTAQTSTTTGIAQANLPITGAPRNATLTVSSPPSFYTAASISQPFVVQPIPTSTSVTSSPSATVFGQSTQLSAHVSNLQVPATSPTGTVQFKVDGVNHGAAVPVDGAGNAVSTSITTMAAGTRSISAVYNPTGFFGTSTGTASHVVSKASTSISVTPSVNPTVYGQPVTFTADVDVISPGAGTPTGTVTFQLNGVTPIGGAVPINGSGIATSAPISTLDASTAPYSITATYTGDGSFNGSSTTISQTVNKADTSTAVSSSAAAAVTGQTVTFTAGVSATAPGAGTPTGTATFSVDSVQLGAPVTLDGSGQATSAGIGSLLPGDHTVSVSYSGDDNFNASSTTFTQHVDKAQTTTALSSSVNPSVFGQPVSFTADVDVVAPGTGTPTGTVTFSIDSGAIVQLVPINGSGVAVSDPLLLPVGPHTVAATYSGDGGYEVSTNGLTQTVSKAATTTGITSSVNPSVFGQAVTFDATVAVTNPGAGTPTGTVSFFDGATLLSTQPLAGVVGGGTASFTTSSLTVGTHAVTATFSGDGSFDTSSGNLTQGVNKSQSTTVVAANGPIVQGQPVSFTASVAAVAPGSGIPTGTVSFRLNGAPQGGPVALDASGNATSVVITGLTPGSFTLTATYSGSGQFLASAGSVGQIVNPATATTSLAASPSGTSAFGAPVTLTATVSVPPPAVGIPSGSVAFYDGGILLGVGELNEVLGNDQATFTATDLAVGAHSFTATYIGDFNFGGSSSGAVAHTVAGDPTTTAVVSSPNPTTFGASTTITATVTKALPNAAPYSGTVTFKDGATVIGTAAVSSAGTASITKADLPVGTHPLTAVFSGNAVYGASTSPASTHTVTKAPTLITTSRSNTVITANLIGPQGGIAGQPLVVKTGSTTLCTITTNGSGTGTCTITFLQSVSVNLNGYTVTYAGNGSYLPTNASGQ